MGNNYKKQEVRDLYHVIYNNRIKDGLKPEDAKRIALDAASLRFGITNDRVRHILYDKDIDNPAYRTFIYMHNQEIINSLSELLQAYRSTQKLYCSSMEQIADQAGKDLFAAKIEVIESKINRYNQLISIIQEVNAHYCQQKR